MASAALRHIVLGLAASGLLMGCVEGAGSGEGTSPSSGAPAASARSGGGSDVEAPDLFQVSDSALWDGRPSLGGIWVASPDVVDPQRVVMFNPANGKSVNGALFKRERDNPGPPLQVSSDAAEALGMLAGQPTALRVTALQKKEAAPRPAAEPAPAVADAAAPKADAAATAEAGTEAAETAALATAALAATGAAAEAVADPAAAAVEGAVVGAAEGAVAEAPKRKTWKERRAEAKARREAEKAAKAAADAAAETGAALPEGIDAATAAPTADSAGVAVVETAPLDARSPEVAATASPDPAADHAAATATEPPAEPVKKTRRQIREEKEAAAAAAAAAEAPAAEATAPETTAARPIQIASFSKEENANRAVEALAKVNVTAQTQKSEQGGKVVWGVVTSGDAALLASIKDAGFADAFFLK